jgi:hypothetical protein
MRFALRVFETRPGSTTLKAPVARSSEEKIF